MRSVREAAGARRAPLGDPEPCFVLEAPGEMAVAAGITRRFDGEAASGSGPEILRRAREGQDEGPPGGPSAPRVLVGAVPFDRGRGPSLIQPRSWIRRPSEASVREDVGLPRDPVAPVSIRAVPERGAYLDMVRAALREIGDGTRSGPGLGKVVLARTLVAKAERAIDPNDVLERLRGGGAATFGLALPPGPDGGPRHLVGASPELLVAKRGTTVASTPLAGSASRSTDPAEDRAAAERLLRSAKDLHEHALVVEHVLDILGPYCRRLAADDTPRLTSTAAMWHLATHVEGELQDADACALTLARALHPTPAIGGVPTDAAIELIGRLEPFDRGFYSGAVGWVDARGDGRWMLTIRCAEISGRTAVLYAGAGIVAGSEPEAEAAETSAKFVTLLRALGIDEGGAPLDDGRNGAS